MFGCQIHFGKSQVWNQQSICRNQNEDAFKKSQRSMFHRSHSHASHREIPVYRPFFGVFFTNFLETFGLSSYWRTKHMDSTWHDSLKVAVRSVVGEKWQIIKAFQEYQIKEAKWQWYSLMLLALHKNCSTKKHTKTGSKCQKVIGWLASLWLNSVQAR